ncbi:MAG: hypothetical protein KGZ35_03515 [Truepera sp.]|nr:hypothetical protein [Truepera sp.]
MTKSSDQIGNITIELEAAPTVDFPTAADCNSPCWWHEERLYILNSTGHPIRSSGSDIESMTPGQKVTYTAYRDGGRWIESVFQDADGTLFGWYHNEPAHLVPPEMHIGRRFPMTAPFIGAAVSDDNGQTWDDLGLILAGGPETLNLEAPNFWFAGGNGDFTVILDRQGDYFYFLFGTYYKDVSEQGVSLARMRFEDLRSPVGKAVKWFEGDWSQPGLNGHVTPILPAKGDWYGEAPDAFWGPSVHWNTHLKQYVILLNRAVDRHWKQGGIYLSLTPDIADPHSWSEPLRILAEAGWYPQVVGCDAAKQETDREAGELSRLFIHGKSQHYLRFHRPEVAG